MANCYARTTICGVVIVIDRLLIFSGLVFLAAANTGAQADEEEFGSKTVIGEKTPLIHKCYQNARDGDIDSDALEPCHRSLAEEELTRRKTAIAHANRGVVQINLGDYEAAIADFSAALRLGIHVQARIYVNRGLSYEALRYDALARADYQAALAINPDNPIAARRRELLKKPLYDRSTLPRKITAELPSPGAGY